MKKSNNMRLLQAAALDRSYSFVDPGLRDWIFSAGSYDRVCEKGSKEE